ncbi:MAG: ABC transporter ATP-binding protein [Alphaproteobacteria bacterium]|nr:ABC transporter ATP-binding protein [Alphaproteobacteria bacterium]TAD87998.1 MAG: ABC transporter ATP-binding protein [Alphaproteobacteria bacterium]
MLSVTGLEAGYGPVTVLRGLSMTVAAGEIVAVLGSNGVGKSTLNNTLSGLVRARAGSIQFDGAAITTADPAAIVAAGLIHVPEGRRVFPNLSVRENLILGSYRRGRSSRSQTLDRVVTIFPRLKERFGQYAGTLSGGEQQMLAIGRGLMAEPKLLILDEPSLGLSPLLVEEMFALIAGIAAAGPAVVIVEQNVVQSLSLASRGYVLEQGVFALTGSATDLLADPRLRATYLGL